MKKTKMAILTAGGIAEVMAQTIREMEHVQAYAVAARSYERAKEFADKYGFDKAYGSYEEMLQDAEVELVYIASPHSHHYEHAKMCIDAGKSILCEKAFTANAKQAEEILNYAKEKQVFITEAMWVRYLPMKKILQDVISSDIIGEPMMVTANLGYLISHVERLREPALAGGALLDVGVYPINFASIVLGDKVQKISSAAVMTEKGVDSQNSITIIYEGGKMAVLNSSSVAVSDRKGIIQGTNGYIVVENINNFESIKVYDKERVEIASYDCPKQISGYEFEVNASIQAMESGKIECEEMPHQETIRIMKLMDDIRAQWNMKYPFE